MRSFSGQGRDKGRRVGANSRDTLKFSFYGLKRSPDGGGREKIGKPLRVTTRARPEK